jgi:hypothetical protein
MSNEPILPPWLEVEDDEEELEYPYPAYSPGAPWRLLRPLLERRYTLKGPEGCLRHTFRIV